jgi:hypothetical protein
MRAILLTAVLIGSSSLCPSFAQDEGKSQVPNQAQAVPVQPERTPQQSEQSREQDRERAEDVRVGRGWRTEERDSDRSDRMGQTNQAQTPVQPERTLRQSERSREQDRERAEDVRVGRGWRTEDRDSDRSDRMGHNDMGRTRDETVGRNWRMRPDDDDHADRGGYGRGYYDEDRPRRRVKVCVEYADGHEYCRYRD